MTSRCAATPDSLLEGQACTAIVLGASGSVGQALLAEIGRTPQFSRVIVIARRSMGSHGGAAAKVEEWLVPDMQALIAGAA